MPIRHTVVVLVGKIHKGTLKALAYAKSLRPEHLVAVYVSFDDEDREEMERHWREFDIDVPLEIIHSPYRELADTVVEYVERIDELWDNDTITVVIPEFVVTKWYGHLLHNQTALFLKGKLLFRDGVVVTSVPYHVDTSQNDDRDTSNEPSVEAGDGQREPAKGAAPTSS